MKEYVYPKLPAAVMTTSIFRLAGNGLANCLYVYARAISRANRDNLKIIAPTWFNLAMGPYLRNQKDKRHYNNLFKSFKEIGGLKKFFILTFRKNKVITEFGLGNYFKDILNSATL